MRMSVRMRMGLSTVLLTRGYGVVLSDDEGERDTVNKGLFWIENQATDDSRKEWVLLLAPAT